jgi:pilus assembly protein Flp/PilA
MSLHPQLLADAPRTNRSGIFRLKALFCEQRARESSEPRSRSDWEELAIEWHMMANLASGAKTFQLTLPQSRNELRPSIYASMRVLLSRIMRGTRMRGSPRIGRSAHWRRMNAVRRFLADTTAATAIEYCIIAAGIALGIFVAVAGIEAKINAEFMAINGSMK